MARLCLVWAIQQALVALMLHHIRALSGVVAAGQGTLSLAPARVLPGQPDPRSGSARFRAASIAKAITGGLLAVIALSLEPHTSAQAQDSGPIWGAPFNVSNSLDASVNPTIACDGFGYVHVFWSEKTQGEPREDPGHDVGDSIFYRQRLNGTWSPATDIAYADEQESSLVQPTAVVDNRSGTLYLIWSGYRGIYFSSAPVALATSAAAWAQPVLIVRINPTASFSGPVKRPQLVLDELHNSLHLIYSLYGTNGNLFYLRSTDLGHTWDEPRALTDVTLATSSTIVAANGRIRIDNSGNIHVIWDNVVKRNEDWYGTAIKHSISSNNGDTWSAPSDIGVASPGMVWWGIPDLAVTEDKLHVVFACGDRPRRCYTYSADGGLTWAEPEPLFGDFMSLAGWDSLSVDMNGRVHLIAQLRDLRSRTFIWHAELDSRGWPAEPSRVPYDPTLADHFPESCTSLGNHLHLVLGHESQGEVWHLSAQLYQTGVAPLSIPTRENVLAMQPITGGPEDPRSAPSVTMQSWSATMTTETPFGWPASQVLETTPLVSKATNIRPLALGALSATLITAIVILHRIRRR